MRLTGTGALAFDGVFVVVFARGLPAGRSAALRGLLEAFLVAGRVCPFFATILSPSSRRFGG